MILYILRHATAEPHTATDTERKLTSKGRNEATAVGEFCHNHHILPDLILTSPVVRARETAELVQREISREIVEVSWLACGMSTEEALNELRSYAAFESVMMVGHEPDLSELIACLLGMQSSQSFVVSKASLTIIELNPTFAIRDGETRVKALAPGRGVLKGLLPVKMLL